MTDITVKGNSCNSTLIRQPSPITFPHELLGEGLQLQTCYQESDMDSCDARHDLTLK